MAAPAAGAVVVIPFPFSDLSQTKLRPALVLASAGRNDVILCQITSNSYADTLAVELDRVDFVTGSLQRISYARPGKLFTANESLVTREVGHVKSVVLTRVIDKAVAVLKGKTGK